MDTKKNQESCDLCGQPVEIKSFSLSTKEGIKKFCCAGCQSIFQLLNEEILIDTPPINPQ